MDPISPIVGLIGAGLQAQAQAQQQMIQYQQMLWAKEQARRQERFASAARSDPYGNKTFYDEALNEWKNELTPTQNQILKAGEAEQLRSVTEDAMRNRDIKREQRKRGLEAQKDYTTELAAYKYKLPKTEGAIRDELQGLISNAAESDAKSGQANAIRALIREKKGGLIPNVIRSTDQSVGKGTAERALQARQGALQESQARGQAHEAKYLPRLESLRSIMSEGGGSPQRYSETPQTSAAAMSQQAQMIQAAMAAGASNVGNAVNAYGAAAGKSPDLTPIMRGIQGGYSQYGSRRARPGYNLVDSSGSSSVGTSVGDQGDWQRLDFQNSGVNW